LLDCALLLDEEQPPAINDIGSFPSVLLLILSWFVAENTSFHSIPEASEHFPRRKKTHELVPVAFQTANELDFSAAEL